MRQMTVIILFLGTTEPLQNVVIDSYYQAPKYSEEQTKYLQNIWNLMPRLCLKNGLKDAL